MGAVEAQTCCVMNKIFDKIKVKLKGNVYAYIYVWQMATDNDADDSIGDMKNSEHIQTLRLNSNKLK